MTIEHQGQHENCDPCYEARVKLRQRLAQSGDEVPISEQEMEWLVTHRIEDEIREGVRPQSGGKRPPSGGAN